MKTVVLATALMGKGIGIGVIATTLTRGDLSTDTAYLAGAAFVLGAGFMIGIGLLCRLAIENRRVLGERITNVEWALQDHRAHDRAALSEAVRCGSYIGYGSPGPKPVRRIGR